MVARKRKTRELSEHEQITALATTYLQSEHMESLYGIAQNPSSAWKAACDNGATDLDIRALESLYQLVSGSYEIVEEKYAIKNEHGEVVGTRKVTKPGPNFQAVKLWLDRRPTALSQSIALSVAKQSDENAESKEQLISSILSLIPPKDAPTDCESVG